MNKRVLKHVILVAALLLLGCYAQAQNEASPKNGWLSNRPKKLNLELKVGRGFLSETATEESARVFYGGGAISYGLLLSTNFVGLGAGAEYIDMMEGAYDFPVFLNYQHFFSNEAGKGIFAGVKLGYIFGGRTTVPIQMILNGEEIDGVIERSMKGFYGELNVGYCLSGFNIFASYNYRVIGYETTLYPNGGVYEMPYSTSSRVMHTIMVGLSFMIL